MSRSGNSPTSSPGSMPRSAGHPEHDLLAGSPEGVWKAGTAAGGRASVPIADPLSNLLHFLNQGVAMRILFDGHLDLSWNALSWGRDITLDLDVLNASDRGMTDHPARGRATTTLAEMRRGAIAICQATVLARARPEGRPHDGPSRLNLDYMNQEIAS